PLVFISQLDAPAGVPFCPGIPIHELPMTVPLARAHVISLLEALEELLRDGYRPGGELFLALSFDGLSGGEGARSIAAHLLARSLHPCFVLDYGGVPHLFTKERAACTHRDCGKGHITG
ncbi:MAG: hypothetical protein RSG96_01980, partial [Clostridia bacterium]